MGFRADLDFGKTADLVAAYEPESDGQEIYKHIQQAYVSLLTGKVQWDVGKFVTPIGAEVIESQDNWNYTRSILFGYAIPFYHTGRARHVAATDKLTLAGYLVNGWNNTSEINGDKTCRPRLHLEADRQGHLDRQRHVRQGDPRLGRHPQPLRHHPHLAATPKLSLMANFDYGKEGDVKWWGIAGYAKYQANAQLGPRRPLRVPGRHRRRLHDLRHQGADPHRHERPPDRGRPQARLEYRTDFADEAIFPKDDGLRRRSRRRPLPSGWSMVSAARSDQPGGGGRVPPPPLTTA